MFYSYKLKKLHW